MACRISTHQFDSVSCTSFPDNFLVPLFVLSGLSLQEQAALAMRLHGPPGSLHLGGMGSGHHQLVGSGLNGGGGGMSVDMSGNEGDPNENPPVGCNSDAIKLFIGNVPKSFTEELLCPFFETAGQVRHVSSLVGVWVGFVPTPRLIHLSNSMNSSLNRSTASTLPDVDAVFDPCHCL